MLNKENKISVLIPCYNAEKTIHATLESVKWTDEILVCDSFSTDKTLEIAKEFGARIVQREYINSAKQKNWAIPQCSHSWILQIDSDEVLEEGLKEEVLKAINEADTQTHAFKIRRKNFAYGKWIRYGGFYPDYQKRLFRKEVGYFEEKEIHAHVIVSGKVGTLNGNILHHDFKDLSTWLIKFERYMRYECDQLIKEKIKFSYSRVPIYPPALFIRDFFLKQGFRDGWLGFEMAILNSFYFFLKYAKLWEYEWKKNQEK